MSKVIAFPSRVQRREMYRTEGALALAPEYIGDQPEEIPNDKPPRHVEIISFPGERTEATDIDVLLFGFTPPDVLFQRLSGVGFCNGNEILRKDG